MVKRKKPELVEELISVGMPSYEAMVYYALLKKSGQKISELAEFSEVPRTRIYEVLNDLRQKGFCVEVKKDRYIRYKAISPEFAFTELISSYEDNLKKTIQKINRISEKLQPIYDLHQEPNSDLDYMEIIRERNLILEKINNYGKEAKKEILTMNKAPYAIDFAQAIEKGRIDHIEGLTYKFISEKKDLEDPHFVKFLQLWQDAGAEIRIVDEVPIKLILIDKRVVIMSLPSQTSTIVNYTSIKVENDNLAKMYDKTFHLYFDQGMELEQYLKEKNS